MRRKPSASIRAVLLATLVASTPFAQRDATVERVLELGRTDNRVGEHLEYLTKRIGHRLTSSSNLRRAEEWSRARFEEFGLDARLEPWGEFEVGFERHESSGAIVAPFRKELVFGTSAWRAGTPGPVRARAVMEPEAIADLEASAGELAGVWLVRREREGRQAFARVTSLLGEMDVAGEIRDGGEPIRTGGNADITWGELPALVSVRLRSDQYEDLVERLSGEEPQELELEFDIDNRFMPGPVPLFNVVADLVGAEFPDQYVIVGGHSDSWDGAEGAQDNGTGMATTLEAARLLAASGARPRRTIRFMFWSGEEQGLLGSRGYVEQNPELMEKISAVLVHDGGSNVLSGLAGPDPLARDLRWATEPLVGYTPGMPFAIEEVEGLRAGGSSDHSPFLRAGVPGFFWEQGGAADDTSYRWIHHTQYDTLESVLPHHQEHSAVVVAVTAYNLAMLDDLLPRENLILPDQRRMGVFLDGTSIARVMPDSKASAAGWVAGDVIVAIDGNAVEGRRDITRLLQAAPSVIPIRLKRGEEEIETTLDYSDDPEEARRLELREVRERQAAERKAAAAEEESQEAAEAEPEPATP